jgi:HlyD family secretion protein
MEPVDLDERIARSARRRVQSRAQARSWPTAQAREARPRQRAGARYETLSPTSRQREIVRTRQSGTAHRRGRRVRCEANGGAARACAPKGEALPSQRADLRLIAPVDGLVVARDADPGTTVVAGRAVVELIDPASLWINVRFEQLQASGLAADLPARSCCAHGRAPRPGTVCASSRSPMW